MEIEVLNREKSKVLGKQLKTHNGIVCGVDNPASLHAVYYWLESGELCCPFVASRWHEGHENFMHGGMSAAVLDECMGRCNVSFQHGIASTMVSFMTGEYTTRYLRPIPCGKQMYCYAHVTKTEGRKNYTEGWIVDEEMNVYVKGHGIYISVTNVNDTGRVLNIPGNTTHWEEGDPTEL